MAESPEHTNKLPTGSLATISILRILILFLTLLLEGLGQRQSPASCVRCGKLF